MAVFNTKSPWHHGKQRRPYIDNLGALEKIQGEPDGLVYRRTRGEKLETSIVCGGRGLRWQFGSEPLQGFLEIISVSEGRFLYLTHMRTSLPHTIVRSRDSYLCGGITIDGSTLGTSVINSGQNVSYLGAVNRSTLDPQSFPANKFVSAVSLMMPYDSTGQLLDDSYPMVEQTISDAVTSIGNQGSHMMTRAASPLSLRFIHDVLTCPYQGSIRHQYMQLKSSELLCHLNEAFKAELIVSGLSSLQREAITKARQSIAANLESPYGNVELAVEVGLSKEKLVEGFQVLYGKSPFQVLQDERMKQAEHYLTATEKSMDELAGLLGYSCSSSFIRAFKERYGVTPRRFRCL